MREKIFKILIAIILTTSVYKIGAQTLVLTPDVDDCGEWIIDTIRITGWKTIDTLNYNKNGDTIWINSEWKPTESDYTLGLYCPCGCGSDSVLFQDKVCGLGIIQRRFKITSFKYMDKPESDYEKRIRELKRN